MSLKCYYHPEMDAQSKCEKCGKLICLECKRAFSQTHGTQEHRYSTRHEFCQICYYDRQIKGTKTSIVPCFFLIGFSVVGIIMLSGDSFFLPFTGLLSFIIVLSVILLFYMFFISGPKKVNKLQTERDSFSKGLRIPSQEEDFTIRMPKDETVPLKKFCQECGGSIDSSVTFCPHCGSVIED